MMLLSIKNAALSASLCLYLSLSLLHGGAKVRESIYQAVACDIKSERIRASVYVMKSRFVDVKPGVIYHLSMSSSSSSFNPNEIHPTF